MNECPSPNREPHACACHILRQTCQILRIGQNCHATHSETGYARPITKTADIGAITALAHQVLRDHRDGLARLPGLTLYQRTAPSDVESVVYDPVICLILQGSKMTASGEDSVTLTPGDALLVSHDLPVASRILRASEAEPYTALILSLDLALLRGLSDQIGEAAPDPGTRALSAAPADPAWADPLTRYLRMATDPQDARILGPDTLREVQYRLLLSPIGRTLRSLLNADSHATRVMTAIGLLRNGYSRPVSVPDLARAAAMSPSSFHHHFRTITGTTPLQYLKDLRLIEARTRLTEGGSVTQTAYDVGYESPTHFSRDYSRKFGRPPSRDTRHPVASALAQ